jgi:hypothetical protein
MSWTGAIMLKWLRNGDDFAFVEKNDSEWKRKGKVMEESITADKQDTANLVLAL